MEVSNPLHVSLQNVYEKLEKIKYKLYDNSFKSYFNWQLSEKIAQMNK